MSCYNMRQRESNIWDKRTHSNVTEQNFKKSKWRCKYCLLTAATSTASSPRTNSSRASLLWRRWHIFIVTGLIPIISWRRWLIRDWLEWCWLRHIKPAGWSSHRWIWSNSTDCWSAGRSDMSNRWVPSNRRRWLLWRWRRGC